jgi:hypothetical protein
MQEALTELADDTSLTHFGEDDFSDVVIHRWHVVWLTEADAVIAEVITRNHGEPVYINSGGTLLNIYAAISTVSTVKPDC